MLIRTRNVITHSAKVLLTTELSASLVEKLQAKKQTPRDSLVWNDCTISVDKSKPTDSAEEIEGNATYENKDFQGDCDSRKSGHDFSFLYLDVALALMKPEQQSFKVNNPSVEAFRDLPKWAQRVRNYASSFVIELQILNFQCNELKFDRKFYR